MTSDTLRQKFIYNTPFNDDGFPLLNSRLSVISEGMRIFSVSGKHLFELEKGDFDKLCDGLKNKVTYLQFVGAALPLLSIMVTTLILSKNDKESQPFL